MILFNNVIYAVSEDNHGIVSYWSTPELAKREACYIADEMYDGDRDLIGDNCETKPIQIEEIYLNEWSFGAYERADALQWVCLECKNELKDCGEHYECPECKMVYDKEDANGSQPQ